MKRICVSIVFALTVLDGLSQQDPLYSMYQFNQMIINPAYAGARDVFAVVALTRQQWVGFAGAPKTNCLSLHGPVLRKKLGLGLTVLNDQMGPRNMMGIYGNLAYILKISQNFKLSFGLNAGYNRYQFDFNNIDFKTGQLPANSSSQNEKGLVDINSGLFLRSNSFFMGLSASHLNNPEAYSYQATVGQNNYSYALKTHLFVTLGKSFTIHENLVFAPSTLVRFTNGRSGADLNLNFFLYKRLWLGTFYRTGCGPGALMQVYFNNKLRAGLSYDTGLGDQGRLGPSFEVMIGFDFNSAEPKLMSPRFL